MKSSTGRLARVAKRQTLVELREVIKVYEGYSGSVTALNGINLQVFEGEFLVVTGRSGSGKTTLVNVLTGLDGCTSGEIFVAGTAVHQLGPERAARWRRKTVGVVFQAFELLPTLTALENVMLPMDFAGSLSPRRQAARAIELLETVEIGSHSKKVPGALSGGQQQRLAIARAMANDPPILVADEPTGSLDSVTAEDVMAVFDDLVQQGKTVLLVTHDKDVAAHGSRRITLSDGKIIRQSRGVKHHA